MARSSDAFTFGVLGLLGVQPVLEAVVHGDLERAVDQDVLQARALAGQRRHRHGVAGLGAQRAEDRHREVAGHVTGLDVPLQADEDPAVGRVIAGHAIGSTVDRVTGRSPYSSMISGFRVSGAEAAGTSSRSATHSGSSARPSNGRATKMSRTFSRFGAVSALVATLAHGETAYAVHPNGHSGSPGSGAGQPHLGAVPPPSRGRSDTQPCWRSTSRRTR